MWGCVGVVRYGIVKVEKFANVMRTNMRCCVDSCVWYLKVQATGSQRL